MDELDEKLLNLLERDARATVAHIAAMAGVSRATVKARIERLVERNIIERFTIIKGAETRGRSVKAIVQIEVQGVSGDKVAAKMLKIDNIRALYSTNGRWDYIAELEAHDLQDFDKILRKIRLIDGISLTESNILLSKQ